MLEQFQSTGGGGGLCFIKQSLHMGGNTIISPASSPRVFYIRACVVKLDLYCTICNSSQRQAVVADHPGKVPSMLTIVEEAREVDLGLGEGAEQEITGEEAAH